MFSLPTVLTLAFLAVGVSASYDAKWEVFKQTYNKHYNFGEEILRKGIYISNLKKIEEHNELFFQKKSSYYLAENHLADMTNYEVNSKLNGNRPDLAKRPIVDNVVDDHISVGDLPKSVDWRKHGYVTPVKNQGDYCGSCWAFSSTGSLEGQHFKATGKLVSLSESDLMDCSSSFGNQGCDGGLVVHAFDYVKQNGLDTENSYPYVPEVESCNHSASAIGTTEKGYIHITPHGSEKALQAAVVKHGPISVAIDATGDLFHFYNGGVFENPDCSTIYLDHAVLVVGYDTTADGTDYWIVKNSWGENWGEHGYVRMARNNNNMCGISTDAVLPIV